MAEESFVRGTNSKSICHVDKPTQEAAGFSILLLSSLSAKSILPTSACCFLAYCVSCVKLCLFAVSREAFSGQTVKVGLRSCGPTSVC